MRLWQAAWLLVGISLVAQCQDDAHEEFEDDAQDDEHTHLEEFAEGVLHDELGVEEIHADHEHEDNREHAQDHVPYVPLGTGPPQDNEEPVEEDLSSDQVHRIFRKIDDNLDGKLSMDELLEFGQRTRKEIAEKHAKALLQDIDENRDQKATLEELGDVGVWLVDHGYTNYDDIESGEYLTGRSLEAGTFKLADRDKNGGLDKYELSAILHPLLNEDILNTQTAAKLKKLDRDRDGQLTEDEFFWLAEGRYQDDKAMLRMASEFKNLDKNNNGHINLGELALWESGIFGAEEAMKHLFEVGDKNSDFKITLEEFDSARSKIWGTPTSRHIGEWCDHHEL